MRKTLLVLLMVFVTINLQGCFFGSLGVAKQIESWTGLDKASWNRWPTKKDDAPAAADAQQMGSQWSDDSTSEVEAAAENKENSQSDTATVKEAEYADTAK